MKRTSPCGQHFLSGFDGFSVTPVVRDLILKDKILGFTLFKWNIESAEQLRELNRELTALGHQAGYDIVLAVDQEGGRVERLPAPFNRVPSMRRWMALCDQQASLAPLTELGRILGRETRLAGFNLDFAPVVDVDLNEHNPAIGDRSFSSDPQKVAAGACEIAKGLIAEGVIPCFKHFPGHGATSVDSHLDLPVDERSVDDLWATDILPYREAMARGLVATLMTAHVLYPNIDAQAPATLSPKIIDGLLRQRLGYDRLVFSDDMTMQAIADRLDLADAAKSFFMAGGDVALVCKGAEHCRDIVAKIAGDDDPDLAQALARAQTRISALKARFFPAFARDENWRDIVTKHGDTVSGLFANLKAVS